MCILALDSEVIIANRDILALKVSRLTSNSLHHEYVVLDVSTEPSHMLDATACARLSEALFHAFSAQLQLGQQVIHLSSSEFCLPFLTGWLLGYPCIYMFSSTLELVMLDNPLCMQQLVQTSISARLTFGGNVDLLEFTYPQYLLNDEVMATKVRDVIDIKTQDVRHQCEQCIDIISEFLVSSTAVVFASIIF